MFDFPYAPRASSEWSWICRLTSIVTLFGFQKVLHYQIYAKYTHSLLSIVSTSPDWIKLKDIKMRGSPFLSVKRNCWKYMVFLLLFNSAFGILCLIYIKCLETMRRCFSVERCFPQTGNFLFEKLFKLVGCADKKVCCIIFWAVLCRILQLVAVGKLKG